MTRITLATVATIIVYTTLTGCDRTMSQVAMPSRADCISGAHVVWEKGTTEIEKTKLMARAGTETWAPPGSAVVGVAFPDLDSVYVILGADCDDKQNKFRAILADVSAVVGASASFEVIPGRIEPGLDTIDAYSDKWSDGR
jgi:hypothetical protein